MIDIDKITFAEDELKRIRSAKLLPFLFKRLPLKSQKRLAKRAGASTPRNLSRRPSVDVLLQHYLVACRSHLCAVLDGVIIWYLHKLDGKNKGLPGLPWDDDISFILFCLITSTAVKNPKLPEDFREAAWEALEGRMEQAKPEPADELISVLVEWYKRVSLVSAWGYALSQSAKLSTIVNTFVERDWDGWAEEKDGITSSLVRVGFLEGWVTSLNEPRNQLRDALISVDDQLVAIHPDIKLPVHSLDFLGKAIEPNTTEPESMATLMSDWFAKAESAVESARRYSVQLPSSHFRTVDRATVLSSASAILSRIELGRADAYLDDVIASLRAEPESGPEADWDLLNAIVDYVEHPTSASAEQVVILEGNLSIAFLNKLRTLSSPAVSAATVAPETTDWDSATGANSAASDPSAPPSAPDSEAGEHGPEEQQEAITHVVSSDCENDNQPPKTESSDYGRPEPSTDVESFTASVVPDCEKETSLEVAPRTLVDHVKAIDPNSADEVVVSTETSSLPASDDSSLVSLIRERHFSAAHLIAKALGSGYSAISWAFESLIYGYNFRTRHSLAEFRLAELIENAGSMSVEDLEPGTGMLIVAAYLRPTLMSDQVYTVGILQQVKAIPEIDHSIVLLVDGLIDFANRPKRLDGDILVGLDRKHELAAMHEQLQHDTTDWIETAPAKRNKFQMATVLWQAWVRADGVLRVLLERATRGELTAMEWKEARSEWRDDKRFRRRMDKDIRRLTTARSTKTIRYGAETALYRQVGEFCDLVDRWMDLHDRSGVGKTSSLSGDISILADIKPLAGALVELADRVESARTMDDVGLLVLADKCIDLASEFSTREEDDEARRVLYPENFKLLLPEFDPDGELDDIERVKSAIAEWRAMRPGINESLVKQLEHGRIACAALMAERFLRGQVRRDTEDDIEKHRRMWIPKARGRINHVLSLIQRRELEGALGPADISLKQTFETQLNSKLTTLDVEERFDRIESICTAIEDKLEALANNKKTQIEREVAKLATAADDRGITIPNAVQLQINNFINEGSLSAASELVGRTFLAMEEGEIDLARILPRGEQSLGFSDFADRLPGIEAACVDLRRLSKEIDAGAFRREILESEDSAEPGHRNQEIIKAWDAIAQRKGNRYKEWRPQFFDILRWLGYQVEGTEQPTTIQADGRPYHWTHYRFAARVECPLPRFGSAAGNRLDIVLVWGKPAPETIAQWFVTNANLDAKRPVLVLHLSPLGATQRRAIIHTMRRAGYCAAIVDPCLLAWLTLFGGSERTLALFQVALAGLVDNPYTPDVAGAVPPEMFFGRAKQVEDLWDKSGPCIVYGGRQLGKSALLKKVQRSYNNPESDTHIFYEGLGAHVSDIWERMRSRLIEVGLLSRRGIAGRDRIAKEIKQIFQTKPGVRIVFLLDECDTLLDEDAKHGFPDASLMRDLMTDTERGFKIVLAGLHNVQRFQRMPNQPLAHFGEPICIGPLDPGDARSLVAGPTAALGYSFQPESLVERILAMTNRHPSLLQLFCFELMSELGGKSNFNRESTPPFVIEENDISRIFKKVNLAKRMRERFDWTLDLDPRYRVLGYTFADLAHEGVFDQGDGMPIRTIKEWASSWWPGGFSGMDEEELRGLLDEMIGLGVLVGDPISGYKLRSPNVLGLLGSADNVQSALRKFETLGPEQKSHPGDTHRRINSAETPASPLSIDQEGRLFERSRGLGMIAGSDASGRRQLDQVIQLILASMSEHSAIHHVDISQRMSSGSLEATVRSLYAEQRATYGLLLYAHIPAGFGPTLSEEVYGLLSWMERLSSETKWVRVLLIGPHEAKHLLESTTALQEFVTSRALRLHSLRKWSQAGLKQWFDDTSRQYTDADLAAVLSATGGWSGLLIPVLAHIAGGGQPADANVVVADVLNSNDLREFFGLVHDPTVLDLLRLISEIGEDIDHELLIDFALEKGVDRHEAHRALMVLESNGAIIVRSNMVGLDPVVCSVAGSLAPLQ